jgi:peptidoglycan/LPS O-acetylase OafA/YrhL
VVGSLVLPSTFGDFRRNLANAAAGLAGIANWFGIKFPDRGVSEIRPLIHMWSLSIEEQFYLALPLAVLPSKSRARFAAGLFGGAAVLVATAAALANLSTQTAFFSTWTRIAPIGLGVLVAVALAHPGTENRLGSPRLRTGALVALFGMLAVLSLTSHWDQRWLPRGGYVAVGFLCAAIVMLCAPGVASPLGSLLRSRPALFVAQRSYAIYLWHFPFAFMFDGFSRVPQLLLRVALSAVLVEVSLRLIEIPLRGSTRLAAAKFAPIAMVLGAVSLLWIWQGQHA